MEQTEGPATQLVKQVGKGLEKLSEMLAGSPETTPEDQAQMKQILDLYINLVENKLGGAEEQAEPEGMKQIPVDQGVGGVPMGPQTRQ